MVRLQEKLKKEKIKLDEMIANCDGNLSNVFILEQSRKVDKLIVAYQKIKRNYITTSISNMRIRLVKYIL